MTPDTQFVFLFTDVEGSTRLWEQHPSGMREAMQQHDELLRAAVRRHGGGVVKMSGDGIHAVFGQVASALVAAVDIQLSLREPLAGLLLKVRSAVHVGPAEARDGDYYGTAVNRAARLAAAAHGGQILLSEQARFAAGDSVPPECALRLLGTVRLRDLSAAEPVYQVMHAGLADSFPPLRAMAEHPNNLPNSRNTFIGRRDLLADIDRQFARARLVTLCGAGGMGKSRLAQHAGARLIDRFPDGVWWIELAPIGGPGDVLPTLAGVLKLKDVRGQSLLETVVRRLAGQQVLVMFDNCEHVIDEAARLADSLLRDCPGVQVLATSREPLDIEGEALIQVPPLSTPDPDFPSGLAALIEVDAVRLLLDRAHLQAPDFVVAEGDAPILSRVINRLDGIPLAIELAAARLRSLSLAELEAGLNDRFGLLVAGTRFAPARHKTLRALVDWSFDLLSTEEQLLFSRIAVFAGSFSVAAAGHLVSDALPPDTIAGVLKSLVDKSLIQPHAEDSEYSRYRMLETLRQYAWQRLEAEGRLDAARHAQLVWMADFLRTRRPINRGGLSTLVAELEHEVDNARAALAYALSRQDCAADGLDCAAVMGDYWYLCGRFSEGRRMLEPFADLQLELERNPDGEVAAPARNASAARLHYCLGRFYYMQTMPVETERSCEHAERLFRLQGDFTRVGKVIALRAHNRFVHEGHLASRELYNSAIHMLIEHGSDPGLVIHDLCNVTNNALHAGVMEDVAHYRAWTQRFAEGRTNLDEHSGWRMQTGVYLLAKGETEDALKSFLAAIEICRRNGDLLGEVQPFIQAGIARWAGRDAEGAVSSIKTAFNIMRVTHPAIESINALEALSMVLAESGRTQPAANLLGACDRLRRDTGFPAGAQARIMRERARKALHERASATEQDAWLREGEALSPAGLLQQLDAL